MTEAEQTAARVVGDGIADDGAATAVDPREDWFRRTGIRSTVEVETYVPPPAAPERVTAVSGNGAVTIDWQPVPAATGYYLYRAGSADGPWQLLDHGGGDILAVPAPPYTDTSAPEPERTWYAVSSVAAIDSAPGPLSTPTLPLPVEGAPGHVRVEVDAGAVATTLRRPWRETIGAEHLSMLLRGLDEHGFDVGAEYADALRHAHEELGVRSVRAHGTFLDELGVYREIDGAAVHDFSRLDELADRVLALGLRPVVELSFMPRDLASDAHATVFEYRAIISPPRDWDRWGELVRALAAHLVERYGIDEVASWAFEVWNEPNLAVFWTGDQADYFRLYDVSARAVKSVDPRLRVGGPSTAAAGWVDGLLRHAATAGVPLDFVSTHVYGVPPLDLRPLAAAHGRPDVPILWSEWGVSPTHFGPVNDGVFAAPFVARGMKAAAGQSAALSYWVVSDHFEELGAPASLFHGGFGLLTVGNLHKPRWWTLALLERLGELEVPALVSGDGAGGLVDAWASIGPVPPAGDGNDERPAEAPEAHSDGGAASTGRVAIAIWNGTLDQSKAGGDDRLGRKVTLALRGLDGGRDYRLTHTRVDATHSNVVAIWEGLGRPDWPDEAGWAALRRADRLDTLGPPRTVRPEDGALTIEFDLPMPAVSLIELVPAR